MLKFLCKTFLIALLSCSMMLLDFNSKGLTFQNAQAETFKTEKALTGDMASTLTMTAVGILTSRLYTCTLTTDMMLAAAGGAAFLAGEVLETVKLRKVMKDMEMQLERDKAGNINKEQIADLERLKKSYEEAKSTAGTKKMLQMASAAAFAAAAVVAYLLVAKEEIAKAKCTAALAQQSIQCPSLATMPTSTLIQTLFGTRVIPSPSAAGLAKQISNEAGVEGSKAGVSTQAASLASSYASTCSFSGATCKFAAGCSAAPALINAACLPITPVLKLTSGVCPGSLGIVENTSMPKKFYAKNLANPQLFIMSLLLSALKPDRANADLLSPMGIASSAAISFLMFTSKTLGPTIDSYLLAPMNRAIIWGVLAGLAFAASSATDDVIKKIESNISKIDGILNSMYSMASGATATQVKIPTPGSPTTSKPIARTIFNSNDYEAVDLSKGNHPSSLPCLTGSDDNKCKAMDSGVKDLPSFQALDAESQKQILSIMGTANGLNGTSKISSATLRGVGSMASSANALRANMNKVKADANTKLKASGSKLNIDDASKKFSASVEKSISDALKKGNTNANAMMSSMYGSKGGLGGGGSDVSGTKELTDAEKAALAAAERNKNTAAGGIINLAAPGGEAGGVGLTGMENGGSKALTDEELAKLNATEKAIAGKSIDDYDLKNDISTDKSTSLFELISNRYQQSGYPRLFKKKELKEEAPINK